MADETIEGGCFCGALRYSIEGPVAHVVNCHCTMCRRTSASARSITTLLAPVCFAMLIFVLCLDMLMTRVFMSGSSDAERQRLTMIFRSEGLLLLVLLVSWAPFVLALLRLR